MKRLCFALFSAACLGAGFSFAQNNAPDMNKIMQAMGAMLGGATNGAAPAIVDFRDLKALLPAELPGMKRTSAGGEKNGAMGMTVASAEGRYQNDTGSGITVKIADMGGTGAIGGFMQYGWASMEVDKETDTGYERSTTIAGNKALEKYDSANKSGETQVLVNKHFTVEVSGYNVTAEQIKEAIGKVDLAKLATLQPKPVAPTQ